VQQAIKGQGKLELSVWDFAGQHDYYNNHHYFLQARTVFLVLWKMSDEENGLKGLEFWLRSLASHLPVSNNSNQQGDSEEANHQQPKKTKEILYSIIVVGTYVDHPSVDKAGKAKREEIVEFGSRLWLYR